MDVDAAAVELYGLAPEQFTTARNALIKAAAEEAVKALRRPTLAAWPANQLVRARSGRGSTTSPNSANSFGLSSAPRPQASQSLT